MKRLKASALLYTILISFIIFMIILFFVQLSFLTNRLIDRDILRDKLKTDLNSAILVALNQPFFIDINETKNIKLYEDSKEEITISKLLYGAFALLEAKLKTGNISENRSVMLGSDNSNIPYALYMPDMNNELTISGNTYLRGSCSLPKLGVKQSVINGRGYIGGKLIYGKTEISSKQLPEFNDIIFEEIERIVKNKFNDSIINFSDFTKLAEIGQKFSDPLVFVTN